DFSLIILADGGDIGRKPGVRAPPTLDWTGSTTESEKVKLYMDMVAFPQIDLTIDDTSFLLIQSKVYTLNACFHCLMRLLCFDLCWTVNHNVIGISDKANRGKMFGQP